MHFFGNKKTFAISYNSRPEWNTGSHILVYCHLVLDGLIIGDPEEVDLLGTCISDLQKLRLKVSINEGHFRNPLFARLNDNEILELIYKSNQLKEEYDPAFSYLPTFETNELWNNHTVKLAESTDQYAIVVIEENELLKFIWQAWKDRESKIENLNKVYVDHQTFYSAIDDFISFVKYAHPKV